MSQNHLGTMAPGVSRPLRSLALLVEKGMGSQVWVPLLTAPGPRVAVPGPRSGPLRKHTNCYQTKSPVRDQQERSPGEVRVIFQK